MAYVSDLDSETSVKCHRLFKEGKAKFEELEPLMQELHTRREWSWSFAEGTDNDLSNMTMEKLQAIMLSRWNKSYGESSVKFNSKARELLVKVFEVGNEQLESIGQSRNFKPYKDAGKTPWDAVRAIAKKNGLSMKNNEDIPF